MGLPEFAMIVLKEAHDGAILFCNRRPAISELSVSPLSRLAIPPLPGGSVELPMARDITRAAHGGATSDGRAVLC